MSQENSTSQFQGKTAIISGGAEGIGLSIAKALGEQQMNVVLADIDKDTFENSPAQCLNGFTSHEAGSAR